ncbi:bifunctional rhamnulose-1-phosphate aldolase/short-chain dehydrogenase [Mesorhizobium sp.]|jgi:rhamnulose-1-phosphate aldolase/alcohol dehydrogenase|uniref:bifunctional rhamnulose-1-phosphate aldolase/short-chain dehydrogenase n=1 Tax=Mesorhizobium sp. TaxID=1871066 RepID=UPI000FE402AD|nr:bifunctional rhamnulose-1-phosphate aldolase/short-chain dehydrogenase [Mesorhizobium sp.]RWH68277.1 MAG: bifunctional rhamnulose-1-phosphate aldolase/short-chain dehydrogenase [Mesorhizobium sp.]RWL25145.1 MAG: bifunctional rhamnulose-1-phosphate aldolase/short-chain dehydrogenase [Mesorhizobium sp.]RWL27650.1 MAG: bifunctional rhamnulose-1-phosphate aldolase/short-chain dehydrogenase [Mesorhizobium sp.]RWL36266.1 MAG: bifunctional rhamnulose-1-phosphate aldolase/short-chain dehydrogenase [
MLDKRSGSRLANLWDDAKAEGMSGPELLVYRSNTLGSDKRVTNYGGGNTSSKVWQKDPLTGEQVEVLWVKGSGGDSASIKLDGFATLYMDKLRAIKGLYRGVEHEDEMVGYLPHCTFNLNPRAASIDTPLHAYVPKACVDHMHPDAIIAVAAAKDSKAITKEIFGDAIGWLPWKRPGFELGLWLEKFCLDNPEAKGVVLESHGLFTWGDTPKECYETTISVINQAIEWFERRSEGVAIFGGEAVQSLDAPARRAIAAKLMPRIRGLISEKSHKLGHFDDQPAVLEFVNSKDLRPLAALGTSCPDHFLRTKIRPLVIEFDPAKPDIDAVIARLADDIAEYRVGYQAYYDACKHTDSPAIRDPNAVVYLMPGVGMFTFAGDKATARISGEFYVNAINVMRGASTVSSYVGLPAQEAFDIEYWQLEEAKLQRLPKPKALAGQIALVTGGAGGIGRATANRLLREGACVVLADIDEGALASANEELSKAYGKDFVRPVRIDVTSEDQVLSGFAETAVEFGGIDILVSNAGLASSAPIEETTLALWNKNMDILSTGYFLVSREAFRLFRAQNIGGNVVFVASKNGLAASPNASAYCTAKAAEIHLARCLALEGAEAQIRVNVVNPDAVLRGSKIWTGEWKEQRAAAYKMSTDDLEEHYRSRSMLKRSVFPEDIAEAIYFFASDMSAKSTGNIVNVDAGNAQSFTR